MITLEDVKNYLNITYEDEDVDTKLTGILARADSNVRDLAAIAEGAELTPTEEQLVLDACRYIWNDAFEDFSGNFISVINGVRAKRQVESVGGGENGG